MSIPFHVAESVLYKGHKGITIDDSVYMCISPGVRGSFNLLFARIWGLSYPDFLRYVRDQYGATLHGKEGGYITFTFSRVADANLFQVETVRRWIIMRGNAQRSIE